MEIRQLETFVSVAKNLNFSRAADEINLSQPTISTHISALENYLDLQLFVRNTKEVSLTKAGKDFLGYALKILAIRDQALHDIRGEDLSVRGNIDIISSTIPAQHLLPEIIAAFHKQRPNVIFHVEQADSRQVEREMSGFRYDFGMIGTTPDSSRFTHYPVCDDELVLILPNDIRQSPESIREGFADFIRQVPFIMRESGSGTRAEIDNIFSGLGINSGDLHIAAYLSDAHSILLAVSKGMGVSLIPRVAAVMYVDAGLIKQVEMKSPMFHRQIHLLHNKELLFSPIQQIFCDHVRQFYGYNSLASTKVP